MASDEQKLTDLAERQQAVTHLVSNARRRIYLLSDELEPDLYDQIDFIESCKQAVIRHHACHMNILIKRSEKLRQMEHRLLELIQRLPSRIELKICHDNDKSLAESWLVIDESSYYYQPRATGVAARLQTDSPRTAKDLCRRFEKIWDAASYDTSMRRLSL